MFDLKQLPKPSFIGSYKKEDVIFLLKDLKDNLFEIDTCEREKLIQKGTHYCEMLPVEYDLSSAYYDLFYTFLHKYKNQFVSYLDILCEKYYNQNASETILVSLARAGTPIGILVKRLLKKKYNIDIPHYSISIIRGKGFDQNAIKYILATHPNKRIQFLDGWTGKGTIKNELTKTCQQFNFQYGTNVSDSLAVLADPCGCSELFGTRKDFLIASSLLNSTISGLISRTLLNTNFIGPNDFHGAKYYKNKEMIDISNFFVDEISSSFCQSIDSTSLKNSVPSSTDITWEGLDDIKKIQNIFEIENINHIKPGIGETTRVLLRRVPWKILVDDLDDNDLSHIIKLAIEKKVPVEHFKMKSYRCCGIIKELGESL